MKKILVIVCNGLIKKSGITAVVMNYYNYMDKEGIVVDIASSGDADDSFLEMIARGGNRYIPLAKRSRCLRYMHDVYQCTKKYDVVHIHGNSATMVLELLPSWLAGVGKKIVHCHNSVCGHKILNRLSFPIFKALYTDAVACSLSAGEWLYGKGKFTVLNNAVMLERYRYNNESRESVRRQYGISAGITVIGHVGNMNYQKNHTFIIDIFEKYHAIDSDSVLLLVGDGELRDMIDGLIRKKHLEGCVVMTGYVDAPENYLNAMDYFIFPSRFEGLALAVVEAQVNGLKCFASSELTKETDVSGRVRFISLSEPAEEWSRMILEEDSSRASYENMENELGKRGFDIKKEAGKLREMYLKLK